MAILDYFVMHDTEPICHESFNDNVHLKNIMKYLTLKKKKKEKRNLTALKTGVCRIALISSKCQFEGNTQPRIIDMQHIVRTQKPEEQPMSLPENIQLSSNRVHVLHVFARTCNPKHITQ